MKTNVKPGDLAIIVRAAHSENLGKIVRVLYLAETILSETSPTGKSYLYNGRKYVADGLGWMVESLGEGIVKRSLVSGRFHTEKVTPVPDSYMRPIRDDEQQDVSETERKLEAA